MRAGLISENDLPAMTTTMQELWSHDADRRSSGRTSATRCAAGRSGWRSRPCWPFRSGSCSARASFAGARVPGADRVPAADPLGGADPAAVPHARHVAEERGLPGCVRSVLAAARADDLRRPRRRPGRDRHRALLRRRTASSASTAITLPSAMPYIATGLRISSTVSLILAFTAELFMGTPGLGSGDELRAVVRPERRSCTRSRSQPASSGSPCTS